MKRLLLLPAALLGIGLAAFQYVPVPFTKTASAGPLVQSKSTGNAFASTLAYTSTVTSGNILYAAIRDGGSSGDTITFTDSQSNTWTTSAQAYLPSDGDTVAIGCATAGSTAADTVTFKVNGSASSVAGAIMEVHSANATCTLDATAVSNNQSATSCNSNNVTTLTANDFLVGMCGLATGTTTIAAGTNWSNGITAGNSSTNQSLLMETQVAVTTGNYAATSGTFTSTENTAIVAPFKQ